VGNEVYGSWEYDLHPMKNDPTTYANAVAGSSGFYALMKAADSSAQVGVVVTGGTAYNNWDGKVLGSCPYDFVEFHYYPQNSGSESDAYLLSQTSGAIPSLQTSLNNIKSEVAAAGKSGTPIMVGEFNSVNTNPGKQTLSIVNALFVGMAWGTMLSNDVRVITIWSGPTGTAPSSGGNNSGSLYGWQNFGDYDVICGSSVTGIPAGTILPSGIAMQLIAKFAAVGGQMLATTVNGATNVVAFGASNGAGGYNALLFNLSESVTATVVLTVESPSKGSFSGTAYTYDKALYDNSQSNVWSGYTTASLGTFANGSSVTLPPWSMTVVTLQ
jgi:hypothetical protein